MSTNTNEQQAAGLRALADWVEANPDEKVDVDTARVYAWDLPNLDRLRRTLPGVWEKDASSSYFALQRDLGGGVILRLTGVNREDVCTPRVVGTRTYPATPERVVDVVEWDCNPLLEAVSET